MSRRAYDLPQRWAGKYGGCKYHLCDKNNRMYLCGCCREYALQVRLGLSTYSRRYRFVPRKRFDSEYKSRWRPTGRGGNPFHFSEARYK